MINKLRNKNQNKRGFTLLEVTLYIAILSTLVFGIGAFINLVSTVRVKSHVVSEVNQQALQIIQTLTVDIRTANNITIPSIGQAGASLTLTDSSSNEVEFTLTDGVLSVDRGAGAVELSNSRVVLSDLEFKNLSRPSTPDMIHITFTLSYVNDINHESYDYSKTYVATALLSN